MDILGTIILVLFAFALYFFPTIVGNGKNNGTAIFVLNLFLGWTIIGWLIALIWACCNDKETQKTNIQQDDTYKKLGEIANLKDRGVITEEEYLKIKQELIGLTKKEILKIKYRKE